MGLCNQTLSIANKRGYIGVYMKMFKNIYLLLSQEYEKYPEGTSQISGDQTVWFSSVGIFKTLKLTPELIVMWFVLPSILFTLCKDMSWGQCSDIHPHIQSLPIGNQEVEKQSSMSQVILIVNTNSINISMVGWGLVPQCQCDIQQAEIPRNYSTLLRAVSNPAVVVPDIRKA